MIYQGEIEKVNLNRIIKCEYSMDLGSLTEVYRAETIVLTVVNSDHLYYSQEFKTKESLDQYISNLIKIRDKHFPND